MYIYLSIKLFKRLPWIKTAGTINTTGFVWYCVIYSSGTVWENLTRSIPVLNPRLSKHLAVLCKILEFGDWFNTLPTPKNLQEVSSDAGIFVAIRNISLILHQQVLQNQYIKDVLMVSKPKLRCLRHINFCPDEIWILPWELNRLSLCLWQRIFKDRIRVHNCLFTQDRRIICIQILFSGYNLILFKVFGCSKNYCQNLILAIVLECEQKDFLYLNYFLLTESLPRAKQWFCL